MSPFVLGLLVASGLGFVLWAWSLASAGQGPLFLAAFSFSIPWADVVPLPLPGPMASPSTWFTIAAVAVMALSIAIHPDARRLPDPRFVPFALLASVAVASAVWSTSPLVTIEEAILLLASMSVLLVVCGHRFSTRDLQVFEAATVLGGASVSVLAFVQSQLGSLPVGNSGIPRFETVGGDANATAASLLLPFVIAFGRAVQSDLDRRRRALWTAGAGLCLLGIFLTVSRGALIAVAAGGIAVLLADGRWRAVLRIGLVGALSGALLVASAPEVVTSKLLSTDSTGRTQIWRLGLSICRRECLTGSGFGTFPELYREEFLVNPIAGGYQSDAFKAHNTLLQLVVETGLAGLALYLIGLGMILALAMRLPPRHRACALGAVATWLVTSNLIANITFKYYWLVPAYVVAAAFAARAEDDPSPDCSQPDDVRPREIARKRLVEMA